MAVYFARSGDYIKVGYSADPISRSTTVTTSGSRPLDLPKGAEVQLLGWIPGDRLVESQWHRIFAPQRVHGEWFRLPVEFVRDLIWGDPRGVDMQRMSAQAVFVACAHPELTREQMAQLGVRIEAVPLCESLTMLDGLLGGAA